MDFHGAQGKLDARVVAPSGAEDEAIVQEVDKGTCSFIIVHVFDFTFSLLSTSGHFLDDNLNPIVTNIVAVCGVIQILQL